MFRAQNRATTGALAVLAAGALIVGAAGCGKSASSKPPKTELTSSIDALGDSNVLTVTFKIDATAAELQALSATSKDKLDARTAGLISSADLKMVIRGDKKLKDYKPGDATGRFDLSADVDGGSVFELRTVDKVLYLKADVQKILTLAQKPAMFDELKARAAQLPAFVQAGVAGKWLSFSTDQAKALAGQLGAGSTATPNAQQSRKMLDQLKALLEKDVTVKRLSTGGDKGDHLQLTGSTRTLATDFLQAVAAAGAPSAALDRVKPTDVPDRTVTVDAYVKGGKLSEISLDLAQFATGKDAEQFKGKHLPIVMRLDNSGPAIDKPSGATQIDLTQILPLLGAFSSGASASGSATAAP